MHFWKEPQESPSEVSRQRKEEGGRRREWVGWRLNFEERGLRCGQLQYMGRVISSSKAGRPLKLRPGNHKLFGANQTAERLRHWLPPPPSLCFVRLLMRCLAQKGAQRMRAILLAAGGEVQMSSVAFSHSFHFWFHRLRGLVAGPPAAWRSTSRRVTGSQRGTASATATPQSLSPALAPLTYGGDLLSISIPAPACPTERFAADGPSNSTLDRIFRIEQDTKLEDELTFDSMAFDFIAVFVCHIGRRQAGSSLLARSGIYFATADIEVQPASRTRAPMLAGRVRLSDGRTPRTQPGSRRT